MLAPIASTALLVPEIIRLALDGFFLVFFLFRYFRSRSRFYLFLILSLLIAVVADILAFKGVSAVLDALGQIDSWTEDSRMGNSRMGNSRMGSPLMEEIIQLPDYQNGLLLIAVSVPVLLVAFYIFDMVVLTSLNMWTASMRAVKNLTPEPRRLARLGTTVRVLRVFYTILFVLQAVCLCVMIYYFWLELVLEDLSYLQFIVIAETAEIMLTILYVVCSVWQLAVVVWVYLDVRSCSTPLQVCKRDQLFKLMLLSLFTAKVAFDVSVSGNGHRITWAVSGFWWARCLAAAWSGTFVGLDQEPDVTPLPAVMPVPVGQVVNGA